ncbi:23S rRNA (uracil(1939)-C(5))-methyltransferase RlmD [Terriglobus tenax]|uniref:23S rRNA (uracil(1939)-C(5))-methyltransferase RlmD n=1 Tax=Terriglobus tenax TaxID=1111115 RepID=UPI0021E0F7D9|nr:23S rRNA (uracil(1939)-C(5))-methyltransferase RlmD [Terriglobus tenax]
MKLRIDKAIYGGNGLARMTEGEQAGKAVFVPFVLPGEVVEAHVRASKKGFAEAALLSVPEPSQDRIEARCKHFTFCGGCQYQHATYDAQLAMKRGILEETMQRAGVRDLPTIQVHAAEPWGYRNRIRLRVEANRIGYNRRASHAFLPVEECPIAAPLLWQAVQALTELPLEGVAEVEFFTDAHESKLQLTVLAEKHLSQKRLTRLCEMLQQRIPQLAGASVVQADPRQRGHRGQPDESVEGHVAAHWGEASLPYLASGQTYRVQAGGFFQVNRFLIDTMVRIVTANHSGERAWDLYAGAGLFTAALMKNFAQVTAVEIGEASFRELAALTTPPHRAMRATTAEFLKRGKLEAPDLIVVDPPRAGLGTEVVERLIAISVPRIVSVSCDPATFSRDAAGLLQSGYTLAELHLVDMFPQTFHLETVAVFTR